MNFVWTLTRQVAWSTGALRARRTGLVTMGFFTGAWSMLGLASGVLPLQVTSSVLIAAAICFLIGSARVERTATASRFGSGQRTRLAAPSDRRFMVAIVAETVVIAVMVLVMLQLRLPQYVVPLVAVIVGAHFFLFIRPGDRTVHVIAGVVGIVVGLAGIALIVGGSVEPVVVRGIVGCCFAVVTAYYGCYFLAWRFIHTEQEATV